MRAPVRRGRVGAVAASWPSVLPEQVDAGGAEGDEERADYEPERPAALVRRADEDREAEHDRREGEDEHRSAVHLRHATALAATTMTRTGACLSTKSTVSPKIARLPVASLTRRGPPITMISEPRRTDSSTTARPAFRARTMRLTTLTPYESPIARASSSCSLASRTWTGRNASSGRSSGTSITVIATIRVRRSRARRQATSIASSEGYPGAIGTTMLRYSSAAPMIKTGARTVSRSVAPSLRRYNG